MTKMRFLVPLFLLVRVVPAGFELLPSGLVRTAPDRIWDFSPDVGPEVFLQPGGLVEDTISQTAALDRTMAFLDSHGRRLMQGENLWGVDAREGGFSKISLSADSRGNLVFEQGHRIDSLPVRARNTKRWKSLALEGESSFAVDTLGRLWKARNYKVPPGRFGEAYQFNRELESQFDLWNAGPWQEISCGLTHCAGIDAQGGLQGWGAPGRHRQMGNGLRWKTTTPRRIAEGSWQCVRSGLSHSLALGKDGTVWSWGIGSGGALGVGDACQAKTASCLQELPTKVPGNWFAIGAGEHLSAALDTKGSLWIWGFTGDRRDQIRWTPQRVEGGPWTQLAVRGRRVLVVDREGALWTSRYKPGELVKVATDPGTWISGVAWQGVERMGMAPACDRKGKWGYLEKGKWQIPATYARADLWQGVGRIRKGKALKWIGRDPDSESGLEGDDGWLLDGEESAKPGTQMAWIESGDYHQVVRVPKNRTLIDGRLGLEDAWILGNVVLMQVAGRLGCMAYGDSANWRLDDSLPREEFLKLCREVKPGQAPFGLVSLSPEPAHLIAQVDQFPTHGRPQDTLRLKNADPVWISPHGERVRVRPAGRTDGHLAWTLPDGVRLETDALGRVLKPVVRPVAGNPVQDLPKRMVAVLPWSVSGLPASLEASLTDRSTNAILATRRLTVLERGHLDAVLREQAFQASGACEEDCAAHLGQLLGSDLVLLGNAAMVGQMGVLQVRLVQSSTGFVVNTATATTNDGEDAIAGLVGSVVQELATDLPEDSEWIARTSTTGRVELQGGCFPMGASDLEADAAPIHDVCVDPFRIDPTEVTNDAYEKCVQAGRCQPAHYDDGICYSLDVERKVWSQAKLGTDFRDPRMPVVCVQWKQANDYCRFAKGRLPTEAEWEFAARWKSRGKFPWGDDPEEACRYGNVADRTFTEMFARIPGQRCSDGHSRIAPVAQFAPAPNGLYDMTGNAQEWTADWYWGDYYMYSPVRNPPGAQAGDSRVIRGGDWRKSGVLLRPERRDIADPLFPVDVLGFRCVDGGARKAEK